jgi:hypothetical protein
MGSEEAGYAHVVTDGAPTPIDRVSADQPFYSGEHRRQRMNLQVIVGPGGEVLWVSQALPETVHDRKAEWI